MFFSVCVRTNTHAYYSVLTQFYSTIWRKFGIHCCIIIVVIVCFQAHFWPAMWKESTPGLLLVRLQGMHVDWADTNYEHELKTESSIQPGRPTLDQSLYGKCSYMEDKYINTEKGLLQVWCGVWLRIGQPYWPYEDLLARWFGLKGQYQLILQCWTLLSVMGSC